MVNEAKDIAIEIPNEIGRICLRKDNIITFEPSPEATKTSVDILKHDLVYFMTWSKDGQLPMISDNRNLKEMTSEERRFIQEKLPVFCSKMAILVDNGLSIFFFNVMCYLNKPDIPMKMFKNPEKAFAWLREK